jgi:hypothetical protein
MKIIQSFWSGNQKDKNNSYGWLEPKYNWTSWILSCNQLVKYYDQVELYTDDFGFEILINKLQLPYTKVHVVLNELDVYSKDLWAIAKIKVYSLQNEPFIHVDGDVFIWDKFPDDLISSDLITQNLEPTTFYYRRMWGQIFPKLKYLPKELIPFHNAETGLCANMGIIGGNDLVFIKEFAKKAFEFVDKNISIVDEINLFNFNIFFEQVLFFELSVLESKKVSFLFDEICDDNSYIGFAEFHDIPHKRNYLHLLGDYKKNSNICRLMEIYTMKHYPDYYSKLLKMYDIESNEKGSGDYLSLTKVNELLVEFDNEIIKNDFIKENFLLKRDLNNVGLIALLDAFFKENQNFWITKLIGFQISMLNKDEADITILEIQEMDSVPKVYEMDEVDEILLSELINPTEYFDLVKKMESYLEEEDDQESRTELLNVMNNKIEDYIRLKIISIYN